MKIILAVMLVLLTAPAFTEGTESLSFAATSSFPECEDGQYLAWYETGRWAEIVCVWPDDYLDAPDSTHWENRDNERFNLINLYYDTSGDLYLHNGVTTGYLTYWHQDPQEITFIGEDGGVAIIGTWNTSERELVIKKINNATITIESKED